MAPYVVLLAVLALVLVIDRSSIGHTESIGARASTPALESLLGWSVVVLLIVFSGTRFGIGTDYGEYYQRFTRMSPVYGLDQGEDSYQEPGYIALSLAAKSVSNSDTSIFLLMAALTVVFVHLGVRRACIDPLLALFFYVTFAFYLTSFNTIRQAAAVALIFFAVTYYKSNKGVFVAGLVAAPFLHLSSVIAVLLVLIGLWWRPSVRSVAFALAAAALVAVGLSQVSALGPLVAFINPRYESYLGYSGAGVGTYLVLAIRSCLLAWSYRHRSHSDHPYLALSTIGVLLLAVGTQSVPLARMELYFSLFQVVLLANQLTRLRGSRAVHRGGDASGRKQSASIGTAERTQSWKSSLPEAVIVSVSLVYFFFSILNYGGVYPYASWLV